MMAHSFAFFTLVFFRPEFLFNWLGVYANHGGNVVRQKHQNIEGSDRLQIIDPELSRSTSELA